MYIYILVRLLMGTTLSTRLVISKYLVKVDHLIRVIIGGSFFAIMYIIIGIFAMNDEIYGFYFCLLGALLRGVGFGM